MARGKGKKNGSGWKPQGGKRSGSSGGTSLGREIGRQVDRMSKRVNVHGDGKANQNRSGGRPKGSSGSK